MEDEDASHGEGSQLPDPYGFFFTNNDKMQSELYVSENSLTRNRLMWLILLGIHS